MSSPETQTLTLDEMYRLHPFLLEEASRAYSVIEKVPAARFNGKPKTLNNMGVDPGLEHVLSNTRHSFKAFLRNEQPLVSLPSFQPALANLTERGGKMRIALLDADPSEHLLDLQSHYSDVLRIVLARTGKKECTFPNAAVSDNSRAYEWGLKRSKAARSELHFDDWRVSSVNSRLDIIWKALTGEQPEERKPHSWMEKMIMKLSRS